MQFAEGEDRLVKSVIFRFTNDGKLIRSKIEECIINSNKRLTYEQAILFLRGKSLDSIKQAKPPESRYSGNPGKPLSEISDDDLRKINLSVQKLWSIASKLRNARMKSGSLNLESAEIKILVDEKAEPEKILTLENDESHQLVEEFMLLANETVAKQIRVKN